MISSTTLKSRWVPALAAAALSGLLGPISAAGAAPVRPSPRAAESGKSHAVRTAPEALRRPHQRVRARASSTVVTVGGSAGNYTSYTFNGCSSFTSGGYAWQACRFDWFFGGESQYTTWDHYYAWGGAWRFYGTWRCETASRGGACRWL
jgi:hypothetical protein